LASALKMHCVSDTPVPLIKEDGTPFSDEEIDSLTAELDDLDDDERANARNENAEKIAEHDAKRLLVVSGPGTGKSTLFKKRLVHWLEKHPENQVAVATFVRSLVRDLNDDIANDDDISAEDKKRVIVMTLHRHARSIIERNRGTQELKLKANCAVINAEWEEMVWLDAVSLCDEFDPSDYPWVEVEKRLFDADPPTDGAWGKLRKMHVLLEEFYNALTFQDLILFATQAVRENPELVENTLYIIDEFQDFNRAEDALIREITNESPAQLLVGDDDQVLYDKLKEAHADILRGYYRDTDFVNAMLPFCGRCSIHICRTAEAFLARERESESIRKVFLPLDRSKAELVKVVATTSPKVGVEYITTFLDEHKDEIEQRQKGIREGTNKDAAVLILSPSREMRFLNVDGARGALLEALSGYEVADERPGEEYWRVRDYYFVAVNPSSNYIVRKVLAHEGVGQDVVKELLTEALENDKDLADLEHATLKAVLDKCSDIRDVLERDDDPADQAQQLDALLGIAGTSQLSANLEKWPVKKNEDPEAESVDIEQKAAISAVELNTIVGAKGLSADHVIVLGCDETNLAYVTSSAFFVALTRARKSLTLLMCVGGGNANILHEFICSLPDEHAEVVYVKVGGAETRKTIRELQEQLERWTYQRKKARMKPRARRS
jgi:superfamily I DNA/RNA helicase